MSLRLPLCLAALLAAAGPADATMAELSCDDSVRISTMLTHVMGAQRQAMGLRDPETTLEVWVTRHDGAWLIVQSYANGTSCIVAMGEHWEAGLHEPA